MNILPKKSWHVRSRKNITRVREDEKKAANEEKDRIERIKLAEQEAKINLLRQRREKYIPQTSNSEHINFFNEVESGKYNSREENRERINEQKLEREKYEKQVGYLTYLGQDTNEILNKKDWYEKMPVRNDQVDNQDKIIEASLKSKLALDPVIIFRKYISTSAGESSEQQTQKEITQKIDTYKSVLSNERDFKRKNKRRRSSSSSDFGYKCSNPGRNKKKTKKKKKNKKKKKEEKRSETLSSSDSEDLVVIERKRKKIEILRRERLERERVENQKAQKVLAKAKGNMTTEEGQREAVPLHKQKYNSQFMPSIARQNQ